MMVAGGLMRGSTGIAAADANAGPAGASHANAGQLPFTGAPVGVMAAAGVGLPAVAITCILLSVRRRRASCAK
ncbi:hypothetical protein [Planotetraspora mira]|nr:hypothetical protein [Planotetraspora mira]